MRLLVVVLSVMCVIGTSAASYVNSFCLQRRCPYDGYFRCKVTGNCISPSSVCNGYNNCKDGSDEENCGNRECIDGYGFYCDNGTRCISYSSVCNYYISCSDGADEINCLSKPCPYDGNFKCNDTGVCLRSTDVCNGYSECQRSYGSDSDYDEQNCESKPCPYDGDFKCNNTGECLRSTDLCDGYFDCENDYDEQNCGIRPCPYDGDHRCGDGRCIRLRHVCNGYENCDDGSDEIGCRNGCPFHGDIHCGGRCYRSYDFCDGRQLCYDENTTNCSSLTCPYEGDFRCSDGSCVRSYEVCNGRYNCRDGSDEINCSSLACTRWHKYCNGINSCESYYVACRYSECGYNNGSNRRLSCFYCGNSTRLTSYRHECDGIQDCADGSDELNCYNRECFAADDFRCTTTGACIRKVRVCDGVMHCSDGSDEMDCLLTECPIPGDAKCKNNGSCIHADMVCNGVSDCMDGSDETNCSMKSCPYSDDVRCSTSQACIRSAYKCNDFINCEDGSDEKDCYNNQTCPYDGDFQCVDNGVCIRATAVCDGSEDCIDGSDEGMNFCPEEVTMGVLWERSATKTTYKHQCSDIHPSFKLTDMVARECMKNKRWGPVDMSQCIMDVDSPVVVILTVGLSTESSLRVQQEMDQIITDVRKKVLQYTAVHVEVLPTVVNVSLKITYQFDTLTTDELEELVNFEVNVETLGNFNVSTSPQLTIFESTNMCQCPMSVKREAKSIVSVMFSVCSGSPCNCDNESTCQCVAPFVGNGVVCGRDSDGDGYADMKLNCDGPECEMDICAMTYNPDQTKGSCDINATEDDEDSKVTTVAAVGITFILTLIFSISLVLLIVCIFSKKKKKSGIKNENISAQNPTVTSTAKCELTNKNSEVYEFPDNFVPSEEARYQRHPDSVLQRNPAYGIDQCNTIKDDPQYEESPVYDYLD